MIIEKTTGPHGLKDLNKKDLALLCEEIRTSLIDTVSKNGGHLSSNLGVVELTVALHKVFESPVDKIVWDVGHQCYVHKMLTGRFDRIKSIRKKNGLAGFPKPSESEHDPFIAGHSSTSLSVACGLAKAKELKGEPGQVIAVIGDGALTGGMVYEALNNAGHNYKNLIIVLNDNKMSISKNVGGVSRFLSRFRNDPAYYKTKKSVNSVLEKVPVIGTGTKFFLSKFKDIIKDLVVKDNIYDDLGFEFFGPVDGHNIENLCEVFEHARYIDEPVVINVTTTKGKGYSFAEDNPGGFHGISKFNIDTGHPDLQKGASFSSVFGEWALNSSKKDDKLCAITAAMKYGTSLQDFAAKYPNRFFDVGIAEAHAVTFSAALSSGGMTPIFAVYSSFLQRGYDQLIHDVGISGHHVVFAIDRAGLVGEDGETHHGVFDVGFLSTVPGMTVYSPATFSELTSILDTATYECSGPVAVRYSKGSEDKELAKINFSGDYYFDGDDSKILVISYGREFAQVNNVKQLLKDEKIKISTMKLNKIIPVCEAAVETALNFKKVVFIEEGIENGGVGSAFLNQLSKKEFSGSFYLKAIDGYITHGKTEELLSDIGLDQKGIYKFIKEQVI